MAGYGTEANPGKPTVRLVQDNDRSQADVPSDLKGYDAEELAPALAMMDINERADSAVGSDVDPASPTRATFLRDERRSFGQRDTHGMASGGEPGHSLRHDNRVPQRGSVMLGSRDPARDEVARKLGVENVLDLQDSEESHYYSRQAPAVVHETIKQDIHEVLHEVYERDIHEHDVYHRILPVQEVEVLPPRHFVEDANGKRREVPAQCAPGLVGQNAERLNRKLAASFKSSLPAANQPSGPRRFTARQFRDNEGDSKRTERDGTWFTNQTWVHPPMLEKSSFQEGEAYHVHFDE